MFFFFFLLFGFNFGHQKKIETRAKQPSACLRATSSLVVLAKFSLLHTAREATSMVRTVCSNSRRSQTNDTTLSATRCTGALLILMQTLLPWLKRMRLSIFSTCTSDSGAGVSTGGSCARKKKAQLLVEQRTLPFSRQFLQFPTWGLSIRDLSPCLKITCIVGLLCGIRNSPKVKSPTWQRSRSILFPCRVELVEIGHP